MVLALSCLSILAFINQRDTDKLAKTVEDLTQTRSSIDRVDEAIRLLYAAENNCRLFILQKDSMHALAYQQQLQQVAGILDSISGADEKQAASPEMENLVAEKAERTQQYVDARLLLDSLIQLSNDQYAEYKNDPGEKMVFRSSRPTQVAVDTAEAIEDVPAVPKRKFLKRLGDAITNKQYQNVNRTMVIHQKSLDSVYELRQQLLENESHALQEQAELFKALKAKEQAMLDANHDLLDGLQSILASLKSNMIAQQAQRKVLLSKNAFSITKDIRFGNTLLIVFGLLLTLIIILILQRLFKNSTQLKKAKEKAEEYARLKSEFAETMSHEIRTPLHSITRFANELSADRKTANQSEVIDAIKLSSGMLLSVVNNILDYTKMEKGKFRLAELPFNPKDVIGEVLSGLMLQAKIKQLRLEQQLSSDVDTTLLGDAFQLRQLLINILSNAIKYTDKGSIQIAASIKNKSAGTCIMALAIKDTGIGIDGYTDDKRSGSIFDTYVTAVHNREIKEGSTGLGLSIVKRVVDLHKGKIDVKSVVGKGTTFYIELPYKIAPAGGSENKLASQSFATRRLKSGGEKTDGSIKLERERTNVTQAPSKKAVTGKEAKKGRIIVVDNDLLNRTYIAMLLKREGYQVVEAESGKQALDKMTHERFDLVITDISMPEMDGYQLAGAIKSGSKRNSKVPILGVSGQQPEDESTFRKTGATVFDGRLLKPFEPDELLRFVEAQIGH